MKKNQKYRKQKKMNQLMPAIFGAALILIGFVLFAALKNADEASAADSSSRSVIPLAVNYSAPALTLENINGQTESLEDFRGQVVLVNNWATWCPPCKAEMPSLEKYYAAHQEQGFTIIAIDAGDPKSEVTEFSESFNLTFHIWLDPQGDALKAFKNGSLPNSYVIDREGTVRYAWTGEISFEMLEKYVTPVIIGQN